MPKTFTETERAYIKNCLIEQAKDCLILYGIKKTTVDELVRRANIPKGTFYLFFQSKEHLFFEVICALHDAFQDKLRGEIAALKGGMDAEKLTDILFGLYRSLDGSYLPQMMANGELELLMRRLPPELVRQHAEMDDFRVEELVALVPNIKTANIPVFSAALRGIFIPLLPRRDIGETVFDEALRVMLRGVVIQMFEGEKP
jgi:AcrR family transcriptional regulator